jgi:hypothetical protein
MRGEGAVNIEYQRPLPPDTAADDVPVGERESKEEDANDE